MNSLTRIKLFGALIAIVVMTLAPLVKINAVAAITNNTAPQAKISFTFDDGLASAATQAAPILAKYGLSGTDYIITGCIGMAKIPNTCHANTDASYMTWAQVTSLQNTYGWEIGSHSVTHPYLATSDATDGQPKPLTASQMTQEITASKTALAAQGITVTDFSTPYGDYNNAVLAQIAKVYASHRGFADENNNVWPYNDYLLNDYRVQEGVTVAQVKARIDQAIANNYWLVLTMHDIMTAPSTDPNNYQYGVSELDQIAAYVKTKQAAGLIQSVHINQGLVTSIANLLPNSSFNDGVADGWTTDSPTTITKDVGNNGSYPDSTNSIKLVSSTKNTHLFSPKVSIDPNATYMLKDFLNVQANTGGEVAFYIDEYDANGNWISGQYKTAERSSFVENLNFTYKPSSVTVSKASLQVIVTANSGITAYLDNAQWFPLQTTAPQPQPTTTNLALNRPSTASSLETATGFGANLAVDGNTTSRWASAPGVDPQWLYVDLGATYTISHVTLNWEVAYAKAYQIQISNDAVTWTNIYSTTTGTGGVNDLTGLSGTGRYVRMYGTARGTTYGYSLYEFSVYGSVPVPPSTNLVANGSFDNGIADDWTTDDPTNIQKDTANNGSPANPINSIKLVDSTKNTHLFSPKVAVDTTKTYNLTSYLNLKQITSGEVGFYIDEYDVNGNWISGQYKTGVHVVGAGSVGFTYKASSVSVKSASLQVIVVGNSGITAYFDDVRWL